MTQLRLRTRDGLKERRHRRSKRDLCVAADDSERFGKRQPFLLLLAVALPGQRRNELQQLQALNATSAVCRTRQTHHAKVQADGELFVQAENQQA